MSNRDISSSLSQLKISTASTSKQGPKAKAKKAPVVDSWDGEDLPSSSSSSESEGEDPTTPTGRTLSSPTVPPPTPASPFNERSHRLPSNSAFATNGSSNPGLAFQSASEARGGQSTRRRGEATEGSEGRRPEKSAAAASRLIAGALGIKAPKPTAEGREYERVVRENERKRREEEKARLRENERGKLAIWED